jgi:PAS domain S-box-containing protein
VETKWKRKDGTIIDVQLSSTPINPNDLSKGVTFTALDITDRKHAEEKLRKSEQQLKEAQRMTKMGYWENNLESDSFLWSDEMWNIFALRAGDIMASYDMMLKVMHPEDREFVKKSHAESVTNKNRYDIEYRLLLQNGVEKWIHEIGHTEYDKDGKPVRSIGVIHDVTEIKRLRGIIPICAVCHKLRNDDGYWQRVDQYLAEHSVAKFSHGMCANCADEFYGGQDWYEKNRHIILKQDKEKKSEST